MKKLFSLLLVVVLAATMVLGTAAADTELTLTEYNQFSLADAVEGDTLVLVIECTEATADIGWGIGGIDLDGDWNVEGQQYEILLEATPAVGDKLTFTYDAMEMKNAASDPANLIANFYNGFVISSLTLKNAVVEEEGGAEGDDSAQTGDMMNVALLAGVAALAFVAVVASKKANA